MTPEEFKQARVDLGLSSRKLAERLGVHWRTVQRYASGELKVPPQIKEKIKELINKQKEKHDA